MLTEKQILKIVDEELESLILDEGWKDRITKGLAAAALAGGMGLGGAAQAAPAGELQSVETPIQQVAQSGLAIKMAEKLKEKGIANISAEDLNTIGLLLQDVHLRSGSGTTTNKLEDWAVNWIADSVSLGEEPGDVLKKVEDLLRSKVPPKTTVTKTEFRNLPAIIQQSLTSWYMSLGGEDQAESRGKLKTVFDNIGEAVESGVLSKEQAREIIKIMKTEQPAKAMGKINTILGL